MNVAPETMCGGDKALGKECWPGPWSLGEFSSSVPLEHWSRVLSAYAFNDSVPLVLRQNKTEQNKTKSIKTT